MHIGIITCEILRREIKEVIEKTGVDKVFFVLPETSNPAINALSRRVNKRFLNELAKDDIKIKEKTIEKIENEIRENNIRDSVIIEVMELRMHDCSDKLLAEIEEGIKKMSSVVDFVLLGYGLCGSTAGGVEKIIKEADVPVVIPRGGKGEILNNCIEIALGRERVRELLREEIGTFFMTPAGASIIREPQVILESTIGIIAGKMNRSAAVDTPRIIKLMKNHYRRVVKICYSEADEKDREYSKTVENFAKEFGLEIKIEKGSSKIVLEALEKGHDSKGEEKP
jgi:signal recognition particle subunit SEC65